MQPASFGVDPRAYCPGFCATADRRSLRILGPRRSRRGPSQVVGGRRDVGAHRQPPTPLPTAPRRPPCEPAPPASTRSDSSRPLAVECAAPGSCCARISAATCDPAPYCPILPTKVCNQRRRNRLDARWFRVRDRLSRNLSPPSRALRRIVRRSAFPLPAPRHERVQLRHPSVP